MQQTDQNYKALLTEVIKKQIAILGPDITLVKARNVAGLAVSDDGTVTEVTGQPQVITQNLIDQFVQLSGLIVKKTMEPLLMYHAEVNNSQANPAVVATSLPQDTNTTEALVSAQMPVMQPSVPAQPLRQPIQSPQTTILASQQSGAAPQSTPVQRPAIIPPAPLQTTGQTPQQSPTIDNRATNTMQFHPEQVDQEAQRIIDEALKSK